MRRLDSTQAEDKPVEKQARGWSTPCYLYKSQLSVQHETIDHETPNLDKEKVGEEH